MLRKVLSAAKAVIKICLPTLILLLPTAACVHSPLSATVRNPPLSNEGEVFIFLQPMGEKAAPLTFAINSISIGQQTDGAVSELAMTFHKLIGADRVHTQVLLARARVPAGTYHGLSITIGSAEVMTEDGPMDLQINQAPLWLTQEIEIAPKRAVALFLTFHADKSLASHVLFRPTFSVTASSQLPLQRLGYISMPNDNNILIFHDISMLLTGVIATGLQPTGMAIDKDRNRLYTALGDDSIQAIDMFQEDPINKIRLRPGDDPREIALSPDGSTLVSANYGSNTVSILDPLAMVESNRVRVGDGPSGVVFSPGGKIAYSMNSLGNSISVIDTERQTLSATISLAESPIRGAVNEDGTKLYVITSNSPNLLVVDPTGATEVQKIYIGLDARSIIFDTINSLIYVGRRDGVIVEVDPSIGAYIDTIQLDGSVESMAISDEENVLFTLEPHKHTLDKVNLVSKEVQGRINLPGEAYGISLVGAR